MLNGSDETTITATKIQLAQQPSEMKKQLVWIARYGLTERPLVESVGPLDSDIDPTEGIEHAQAIAQKIASSGDNAPSIVYSSPFLRTTHTARTIATQQNGAVPVKLEEGLWEWLVPSLLVEPNGVKTEPKTAADLAIKFDTIDASYKSVNPAAPDDSTSAPPGSPHFIETQEALLKRCETTMSRLLDESGGENIAIVSHAPCDQAIALCLGGAPSIAESKLTSWPLGGITRRRSGARGDRDALTFP